MLAGQGAAVDIGGCGAGDDVVFVTGFEEGRVRGVLQGRSHEFLDRSEFREQLWDRLCREPDSGEFRDAFEQLPCGQGDLLGPRVVADPGDRGRKPRDGVVIIALGAVARGAVGDEVEPRQTFLRGLDEVDALPADVDGVPADLRDRLCGSGEQFGAVAHHMPGAIVASGLLIGEEGNNEVPSRDESLGQHGPDGGDDHRVHVLHVHRAAAPQQPVLDDAFEGIDAPVLCGCGNDVGVAVDDESRSLRIGAFDAGDEVGPSRGGFDDFGLQVHLGEPGCDEFGGRKLRVGFVPAPVLGVDADELTAQFGDFVLCGTEIKHGDSPRWWVDHATVL